MYLLPTLLRRALESLRRKDAQVFPLDAELAMSIRQTAQEQGRPEEDVLNDLVNAGQYQTGRDEAAGIKWDSLTDREREVLALVCLGQRNYEIANILGIANQTIKTHLQHIFQKFGLHSRKELRLLLRDWNFASWWESRQM